MAALPAWDAALALLAGEDDDDAADDEVGAASLLSPTDATLAAGALLAAWVGHRHGPHALGRSRRRARTVPAVAPNPGAGPAR